MSKLSRQIDRALGELSGVQRVGMGASHALHRVVLEGGESTRALADTLHGTWLGHPLHPVLTDITIGAWTLAGGFDLIGLLPRTRFYRRAADQLTLIGTASAVPTALAGLADYSTTPRPALTSATLHALTNTLGTSLYLLSVYHRRRGRRGRGLLFSTLGLTAATVGAWLGGRLVYTERVGVDHSDTFSEPVEWTGVLDEVELAEHTPRCIQVEEKKVLLYRDGERVYAIGAVCSHAGAPLEEGIFDGTRVECPWHQSVFDLRDGSIEHGPATRAQPHFETRIRDGRIELRLPRGGSGFLAQSGLGGDGRDEDEVVLGTAAD